MKATGIVRRIDELGRVVIPKEIRRTMHLREGEELEIFTDKEHGLIFRKFSPIRELGEFSAEYAEALFETTKENIIITDKDMVVTAVGDKKSIFLDRVVLNRFDRALKDRKILQLNGRDIISITGEDASDFRSQIIMPIIARGDIIGAITMLSSRRELGETEAKLINTAAVFLARHA